MEDLKIESKNYCDLSFYSENDIKQINISSIEHLKDLLQWAIMRKKTLYPVSTGYNWGMGSERPTDSESIVVHLAGMNKIHDFDEEMGTVLIEPGVTQKQLGDFLIEKNSNYFLDTTGSSKDTSILSNALERGISYNSLRCEQVLGLEVLTGNGEFIKTGTWRLSGAKTYNTYAHGIGADLTSLFFQSNFGVVTKMVYKLQLKKKYNHAIELKFTDIQNIYESLVDFSDLMKNQHIESIFHIANTERAKNAVLPYIQKSLS